VQIGTKSVSHQPSGEEPAVPDDEKTTANEKRTETLRRRKEERRTEKLDDMREQVADGSLVVRQMTDAEREAHSPSQRRAD
jgi:hypothetical protein